MKVEFDTYKAEILSLLEWWTGVSGKTSAAAIEMLPSIEDADDAFPSLRQPYENGWSARDAAKAIVYSASTWPEEYATDRHERLNRKYEELLASSEDGGGEDS